MPLALKVDGTVFRDRSGREVTLHGINVSGDCKLPATPDQPSHEPKGFLDADHVSFVGRPFPLEHASMHFSRLRRWGYNVIRYIFTWEALEHAGPGNYDEEYIGFTIEVLRVAKSHGFYVFMDPHQDVWSRFTGGSGAPLWTLYACGLDPEKFAITETALVQNLWPDPAAFPKMIWATNYFKLATQTLFTLFFGGRKFAPLATINGVNIQDFLQDHFIAACGHFAQRIKDAGDLHGSCIIGWESVNEPHKGMIGVQDITSIPPEQRLQSGTSPTIWQGMLTGSGRACEIDVWSFSRFGPYKSGSRLVDPQGESMWVSTDAFDKRYKFRRAPEWKLGTCLWAQHGVWDTKTNELKASDYFATDPDSEETITYEYFSNHLFMEYYKKYRDCIRRIFPDTIMFCQPPVMEIPPSLIGTKEDDPNMVFAPHWYDGLTLITKRWNSLWNIDVLGVLRGRYLAPAFAIKLGERAIRNCFRDQLWQMMKEGIEHMGKHPCVFTEIGIPFDMNQGAAFRNGDYSDQIYAMDANHYALEGCKVGFTLWNYTATNTHKWGDQWNGEDLSIHSLDDTVLPGEVPGKQATSRSMTTELGPGPNEGSGLRAAEAFLRPTPVATHGNVVRFGFELKECKFELELLASTETNEDTPTEVFLPDYHFPEDCTEIELSDGKWELEKLPYGARKLRWWHADGRQSLTIRGMRRPVGNSLNGGDDGSILTWCRDNACQLM